MDYEEVARLMGEHGIDKATAESGRGTDVKIPPMQKGQRTGEDLYAEWCKHDESGVLGASSHFTQLLSPEDRTRLFEYDSQRLKEGKETKTS